MSAARSAAVVDEILLQGPSGFILPPPIAIASDSDEHELQVFWALELARRCEFAPIRLLCLTDVYISPEGLVFFPNGDCLLETIYPWEKTNLFERFPRMGDAEDWHRVEFASAEMVDEAVHLRDPGEAGYFHWINSVLPRAAALQRFHRLSHLPLAIDVGKRFAAQSAALIGFDPAQCLASDQCYKCRKLWVFSPTVVEGDHFTRAKFWTEEVRRVFRQMTGGPSGRRIYLSRQDANVRTIADELQLIKSIEKFGFEIVTIGSMPFETQVSLFASCDVLLSAHGAGLSNAIFMQRGLVIELLSRSRLWPTYRTLSERSGLRYAAFVSRPGGEAGVSEGNESILVDIEKLEQFLYLVLR